MKTPTNKTAFINKLREDWTQGIPAINLSRIFCFLVVIQKYKDQNTESYNFLCWSVTLRGKTG
jgi:hypothetical protein